MKRRNFMQAAIAGTSSIFITPSVLFSGCCAKGSKPSYPAGYNTNQPTNEGQRYLFLDDHWIAGQSGTSRIFHALAKEKGNPVITKLAGAKNVGPYSFSWCSKQPPYSAWFGSFEEEGYYPASFVTSDDGINWNSTRRENDARSLGDGNKQVALMIPNKSDQYGDYPYLGAQGLRESPQLDTYHWRFIRSRDGIHWELFPNEPIWDGPSDVLQIIWDDRKKKFVAYFKVWRYKGTTLEGKPMTIYGHLNTKIEGNTFHITGRTYLPKQEIDVVLEYGGDKSNDGGGGSSDAKMQMARVIGYAESSDFLHWENEQIILVPSSDAPLGDQSYGMHVYPYGNMYIGMYNHFNAVTGLLQPKLAWSYDGIHFTIYEQQFFLTAGATDEWDSGMVLASDLMDTGSGRMYLYYGSLGVDHKNTNVNQYQGALGRAWLRRDGFASLKGGWLETVPLKVHHKQISLNMTGVTGITLKTASGETIGETILRGDHHNLIPDIDLSDFLNREVIVRLDLNEGELFSMTI